MLTGHPAELDLCETPARTRGDSNPRKRLCRPPQRLVTGSGVAGTQPTLGRIRTCAPAVKRGADRARGSGGRGLTPGSAAPFQLLLYFLWQQMSGLPNDAPVHSRIVFHHQIHLMFVARGGQLVPHIHPVHRVTVGEKLQRMTGL